MFVRTHAMSLTFISIINSIGIKKMPKSIASKCWRWDANFQFKSITSFVLTSPFSIQNFILSSTTICIYLYVYTCMYIYVQYIHTHIIIWLEKGKTRVQRTHSSFCSMLCVPVHICVWVVTQPFSSCVTLGKSHSKIYTFTIFCMLAIVLSAGTNCLIKLNLHKTSDKEIILFIF